jgi:hypothetical protein
MNLLRNTPIPCRACGSSVHGRERNVRRSDGSVHTECDWRCPKCGLFLKSGITKIEPAK